MTNKSDVAYEDAQLIVFTLLNKPLYINKGFPLSLLNKLLYIHLYCGRTFDEVMHNFESLRQGSTEKGLIRVEAEYADRPLSLSNKP